MHLNPWVPSVFPRLSQTTSFWRLLPAGNTRHTFSRAYYQLPLRPCDWSNVLLRQMSVVRPGLDAVLHMSRIEFNELSSCEVQRLNQFETADIIRIGLAVLHAWLSREQPGNNSRFCRLFLFFTGRLCIVLACCLPCLRAFSTYQEGYQ